ncbi:MAG: hypothetical protein QUV05_23320, partial [Phycisphaerae bacterium]|nr:hypothetical protein [Phycisphaerae bacterium]
MHPLGSFSRAGLFWEVVVVVLIAAPPTSVEAQTTVVLDNFDSYADETALTQIWPVDGMGLILSTAQVHGGTGKSLEEGTSGQRNYSCLLYTSDAADEFRT